MFTCCEYAVVATRATVNNTVVIEKGGDPNEAGMTRFAGLCCWKVSGVFPFRTDIVMARFASAKYMGMIYIDHVVPQGSFMATGACFGRHNVISGFRCCVD